jgi:hypothetical protein
MAIREKYGNYTLDSPPSTASLFQFVGIAARASIRWLRQGSAAAAISILFLVGVSNAAGKDNIVLRDRLIGSVESSSLSRLWVAHKDQICRSSSTDHILVRCSVSDAHPNEQIEKVEAAVFHLPVDLRLEKDDLSFDATPIIWEDHCLFLQRIGQAGLFGFGTKSFEVSLLIASILNDIRPRSNKDIECRNITDVLNCEFYLGYAPFSGVLKYQWRSSDGITDHSYPRSLGVRHDGQLPFESRSLIYGSFGGLARNLNVALAGDKKRDGGENQGGSKESQPSSVLGYGLLSGIRMRWRNASPDRIFICTLLLGIVGLCVWFGVTAGGAK